jgi:membrane protein
MPGAHRAARRPHVLTRARRVARDVARRAWDNDLGTYAAGIALYAVVTLPAIAVTVVALYGLIASPTDVSAHIAWLDRSLPDEVSVFLRDLLRHAQSTSPESLSIAVAVSILFTIVSAESSLASAASAINRLGGITESRPFARRHAVTLSLAVGGLALAVIGQAFVLLLPWVASRMRWSGWIDWLIALRWQIAVAGLTGFLSIFYRHAPCKACLRWRDAATGAALAAVLTVVASLGLSLWVERITDYHRIYGAAGSMLIVLLWFYLSSMAMLIGAMVAGRLSAPYRRRSPFVSR